MDVLLNVLFPAINLIPAFFILRRDRQSDWPLEAGREIDRFGEHQPVVSLTRARVLGRHAERDASVAIIRFHYGR